MMATTIEIVSIGQAAAWLQASVGRILQASESLGLEPAFRINGVPHFAAEDIEAIGEWLRRNGHARPARSGRFNTLADPRPD